MTSSWRKHWPSLLYWLVCGAMGSLYVTHRYEQGTEFVKLYSHFFMFPLFFGWLSVSLLIMTLTFAYPII